MDDVLTPTPDKKKKLNDDEWHKVSIIVSEGDEYIELFIDGTKVSDKRNRGNKFLE